MGVCTGFTLNPDINVICLHKISRSKKDNIVKSCCRLAKASGILTILSPAQLLLGEASPTNHRGISEARRREGKKETFIGTRIPWILY